MEWSLSSAYDVIAGAAPDRDMLVWKRRFKAPRAIAFSERIQRHASGKPDYQWARSAAVQAVAATKRED